MNHPSVQIPSLTTASPVMPRRPSYVSPQDENTLGTCSPYNMDNGSWMNFAQAYADYGGSQAMYNLGQETYDHMQSASDLHQDLTFDQTVDLDEPAPSDESPETQVQPGGNGFNRGTVQKNFVRKLYDMLSDRNANPYIRWQPDGKSFMVENQEEFSKNVLGRYLKTENFQSFIRQLNMYDFHKTNRAQRAQRGVQAQSPQYVFSHPKFQKGRTNLLQEIKRKGAEQQDAPPQYATVVSGHLPLPLSMSLPQHDHLTISVLQEENKRLREELCHIRMAYASLSTSYSSLQASLQVTTLPQTQNVPSTTPASNYPAVYDEKPFHQSVDLTTSEGNLFHHDYSTSPSKTAEKAVGFPHFTRDTTQSNSNQAQPIANISHFRLDSPSVARRSCSTQLPNVDTNPQPIPRQISGEHKPRPASWAESLGQWVYEHWPASAGFGEAGPSNAVNAFPQDTQTTSNSNHGKTVFGPRAQPVSVVGHPRH